MADVSIPTGAPFEGHPTTLTVTTFAQTVLDDADAATFRTTLSVPPATGKVYLKDTASPAHYWQLLVSTLGVVTTLDAGTTVPTDGVIGTV